MNSTISIAIIVEPIAEVVAKKFFEAQKLLTGRSSKTITVSEQALAEICQVAVNTYRDMLESEKSS